MINYKLFDKCLEQEGNNFQLVLLVIERARAIMQGSATLTEVEKYNNDKVAVSIAELADKLVDLNDLKLQIKARLSKVKNEDQSSVVDYDAEDEFFAIPQDEDGDLDSEDE